jgi:hypothetical protein
VSSMRIDNVRRLHTTVKVMHSIRNRGDIAALSGERRQWVMEAIRATQRQVNLCLRQNVSAPSPSQHHADCCLVSGHGPIRWVVHGGCVC